MRRIVALLATTFALASCAHPGLPGAGPKVHNISAPLAATRHPLLGVDLYALSNYTPAEVTADGQRTLDYIKNVLKADAVGIAWNFYATGPRANTVESTADTLSPANVGILTKIAKQDHLRVEYRPLIMVDNQPNGWEGFIDPTSPSQWFANYLKAERPYLRQAQKFGISEFVTATEMHKLNKNPLWPSFLAKVHRAFSGITSYADWDEDYLATERHLEPVSHLGMDMYRPLKLPADATQQQVTAGWEHLYSKVPASVLQRTAIDEIGIQARAGSYHHPADLRSAGRLDEQVQAYWFHAACATVRHYHMRGLFFWKVDLTDYPTTHPASSLSTFEGKQGAAAIAKCAKIFN